MGKCPLTKFGATTSTYSLVRRRVGKCPRASLNGAITSDCSPDLDKLTRSLFTESIEPLHSIVLIWIDRLTKTTDPRKKQTIQDYDGLGRVKSIIDRNHHTKTFAYNINDNLLAETWDDGTVISYT